MNTIPWRHSHYERKEFVSLNSLVEEFLLERGALKVGVATGDVGKVDKKALR